METRTDRSAELKPVKLSGGGHIDVLIKGRTLQGKEVMETGYDPYVGGYGLIVLERIADNP